MSRAWSAPTVLPALEPGRAAVWLARVSEHASDSARLFGLLDDVERATARRFHFLADQQRYVVAHGVLRILLATYAGRAPEALVLERGPHGKPSLRRSSGTTLLEFNLSHSGDLVAVALARGAAVGVDVEAIVDLPDAESLAEDVFSAAERESLRRVAPRMRMRAFFDCWSRKEAYIKATGVGLAEGLDYFDVSLAPGAPAALLADRRPGASDDWALHDIFAPEGHAGALACAKAFAPPTRFTLSPALARTLVERAA